MPRDMHHVSFNVSNNWDEHPEVQRQVEWRTASGAERYIMFEASVDGHRWTARLNDFPDEPLWTLFIDGGEILHFDDWPTVWGARPPFPDRRD